MKNIIIASLALTVTSLAGEPNVVEQQRGDGLTELRIVSDAGKNIATYQVDLKTHHEPATDDSGLIRQWENYRFGGFFCFNDNQFDGNELSKNTDAKLYNPSKLDVPAWAVAMKNAGMKYSVLTVRHTSGFLLWDSATSDFDVASSPDKTDVAAEFVKECRKQGIAPGFYYCLWGGNAWMPHANARAIILAQLHELASRYGEIPYFWIDMGNWRPGDLSPQEIYDSIKNLQPKAIVILNQHIQDGSKIEYFPTDVVNGEVHLPPAGGHRPYRKVNGKQYFLPFEFEPCSQQRDGRIAWFTYGAGKNFTASQSFPAKKMFDQIKQACDRGTANVFLSLAADHTGSMRPDDVRQLEELGKMLREAGLMAASTMSQAVEPTAATDEAAIAKWSSLGYGMFIHYGMSTFVGNEYGSGREASTTYAPTALDVDQWIKVAHDAGMKYAVLTAKHVAGHCLWDSKVQFRGKEFDHDVATSSNQTDVVAEFVKACKKHDVVPGLYWCLLDLRNNTDMDDKSVEQAASGKKEAKQVGLARNFFQLAQDQFTELIQRYPEVSYYWIDIPRAATPAQRQTLYDLIKRLRPGTVVLFNNGLGIPAGGMTIANVQSAWPTDVVGTERHPLAPGAFNPVQTWQNKTYHLGYEHCDTIRQRWFWVPNDGPRPVKGLLSLYQSVRAGGGNLLLNVPPDNTGRIPETDVKALMELKKAIDDPSVFPTPLNLNSKTTASNVYRNDLTYRSDAAVDNNSGTRWATDDGITNAWLEVDFGKPVTFGRAVIEQAYPELKRVRKFAIEYRQGDEWKECYRGENPGATANAKFEPVTAQRVRLNITEGTAPSIQEFQLFPPTKDNP